MSLDKSIRSGKEKRMSNELKRGSEEFYRLMEQFEKEGKNAFYGRLTREPRDQWEHRCYYQDGRVNELFEAYMMGYQLRRSVENLEVYHE